MNRPTSNRTRNLKQRMKEDGVGALLVTRHENVRYLTGFTGSAGAVLVGPGKPWLITDFRYQLQSSRETEGIEILIQKTDFPSALRETADRIGAKKIWFDESAVSMEALNRLRKKRLTLKGHKDLVAELRRLRDKREVACIRKAISRAEESLRELKKYVRPGARERALALTLEFLMREKGARKAAFDTIIASGKNGAMPHASVTDKRLRDGDMVTIDFGAEADGYSCDITRTFCVGRPTARQHEIHSLVLAAQTAAIKSIRPGMSCNAIDAEARGCIKAAGHGEHFGHGTGHGVGLMVHEGPSVSPLSKDFAEQGMVFTVEPGVYIPGWGGVRIEDMVLVTKTGSTVLTSLPRELEGIKRL